MPEQNICTNPEISTLGDFVRRKPLFVKCLSRKDPPQHMQSFTRTLFLLLGCFLKTGDAWRIGKLKPKVSPASSPSQSAWGLIKTGAHSLPEKFYTGQLEESSNCYLAYSKMAYHCSMISERDRSWLAMLLANCHLEAANRKTIKWHPKHALRYASKDEYSLVNRYIPLISDICSKTGNGHHLALFRTQFHSDRKLWDTIQELGDIVKKAEEVNLESQKLTDFFESATTETVQKSKEVFNLIKGVQSATLTLDTKHKELGQLHEEIASTIKAYTDEKLEIQQIFIKFSSQTQQQMEVMYEGLKTRKEYDQLLANYTLLQNKMQGLQEQEIACQSRIREQESTCQAHPTHKRIFYEAIGKGFQMPPLMKSVWMSTVKGLVWSSASAPFRITRLLMVLYNSEVLSRRTKLIIIGAQAGISFVSVLVVFKVLIVIKSLFDNWGAVVRLIASFLGLFGLDLFPRQIEKDTRSNRDNRISDTSSTSEREWTEKIVRKVSSRLEKRLGSRVQRALQELDVNALLSTKLDEFSEGYEYRVISRMARVEERQIDILGKLQSTGSEQLPPLGDKISIEASSNIGRNRRSAPRS